MWSKILKRKLSDKIQSFPLIIPVSLAVIILCVDANLKALFHYLWTRDPIDGICQWFTHNAFCCTWPSVSFCLWENVMTCVHVFLTMQSACFELIKCPNSELPKAQHFSCFFSNNAPILLSIAPRQSLVQGVLHWILFSDEGGNSESGHPITNIPINYCQRLQTNSLWFVQGVGDNVAV